MNYKVLQKKKKKKKKKKPIETMWKLSNALFLKAFKCEKKINSMHTFL